MDPTEFLLWLTLAVVLLYIFYELVKRLVGKSQRYTRTINGEILEVDLRLPYKRFKELYPWSQITYSQYKKLQMDRAFRKAVSSSKNKRMVR